MYVHAVRCAGILTGQTWITEVTTQMFISIRGKESHSPISVFCVGIFDCGVVWVVLEKAKDGERACVTQHTSSQIMLG